MAVFIYESWACCSHAFFTSTGVGALRASEGQWGLRQVCYHGNIAECAQQWLSECRWGVQEVVGAAVSSLVHPPAQGVWLCRVYHRMLCVERSWAGIRVEGEDDAAYA